MPLCDRWAEPQGPWNYALVPEEGFAVEGGGARIACSAVRCPGWVEKGGTADDLKVCFDKNGRGGIVNSSRGILCAYRQEKYKGLSFDEAARKACEDMKADLNRAIFG